MKRLIRYSNIYSSDNAKFSNCSTKYTVLPVLVDDTAGAVELAQQAKALGFESVTAAVLDNGYRTYGLHITDAVQIGTITIDKFHKTETVPEYLGFITLSKGALVPVVKDGIITKDQASEILNNQQYSMDTTCTIGSNSLLVIEGWDAFHHMNLLGYSYEQWLEVIEVSKHNVTFQDEVSHCYSCGEYNYNDNGYTQNFRVVDECELLGVECGCYDDYCKSNVDAYVNKPTKCIELATAEALESEGKLKHVERFIGGMVDGRGGSYGGESVREGTPKEILTSLLAKYPKRKYVFTHDESGQFQTYFSVWQVKRSK